MMARLWRLTRNRYARGCYETLKRAGITATKMYEYTRPLGDERPRTAAHEVAVGDRAGAWALDAPLAELCPDERVVVASAGGEPAGYLFVSVDATHRIDPLEREQAIHGAYLRRVFVRPQYRQRGVARSLLDRALAWASERSATRATALVAVDNRPSRALFEGAGFTPRRVHTYARVGPLSRRSVTECNERYVPPGTSGDGSVDI